MRVPKVIKNIGGIYALWKLFDPDEINLGGFVYREIFILENNQIRKAYAKDFFNRKKQKFAEAGTGGAIYFSDEIIASGKKLKRAFKKELGLTKRRKKKKGSSTKEKLAAANAKLASARKRGVKI